MNIIKKTHNYTYACSMCHVSSNQLDKENQSKGRQVKSCMNCPDRNNTVDLGIRTKPPPDKNHPDKNHLDKNPPGHNPSRTKTPPDENHPVIQ